LAVAVTPGGPAAHAGVLVGDVLLRLDQTPIESSEELMDLLMTAGAGHVAKLQILRANAPIELAVTLGERPAR
jgi:S1-C subfamily serine protease